MPIDILQHTWRWPTDTAYILGTGPNGLEHYERVPKDAWTIGVNKAIQLWPKTPVSIWLCADGTLPEQEWFQENVHTFIRMDSQLDDGEDPTPCFSTGVLLNMYPDVPYYFTHGRSLREAPKHNATEGVLRPGGSIGAQAVQLAALKGAKRIVLVGCDMVGRGYFNGTVNIAPQLQPGGISIHYRMFNGLCQWVKGQGIEIYSLSKTELNVEVQDEST